MAPNDFSALRLLSRSYLAVLAACLILSPASCKMDPDNNVARQRVEHESAQPLSSATINDVIRSLEEDDRPRHVGEIFVVDGLVSEIQVNHTDSSDGKRIACVVTVRNRDYAAVDLRCEFPPEDEQKILRLKTNQNVRLKGQLSSAGKNEITLIGCLLIDHGPTTAAT